ncbi:hypothetical protein V8E53_009806 [Lactarius tabidus]
MFCLDTCAIDYPSPKPDIIDLFVDLYFTHINLFLPSLHRPTFEHHLHNGLPFRDQAFVSVVLCLGASRYSDDLRVLLDTTAWHSSGWKWFGQVQRLRQSLMGPRLPHDVGVCGSGARRLSHVGRRLGGLRLVQDVGKHRKRMYNSMDLAEAEQWRRTFWFVGSYRPGPADECVSWLTQHNHEDGFDIDMPTEIDDEYWENERDTEQLNQILEVELGTIYSINKSKFFLGFVGPHWEQHIVAELDSALDESIDMVPNHLKWDTTGQNFRELIWFLQFASLYSHYYHLQILVHRPFIPSPQKPSPLSFPSLAILN